MVDAPEARRILAGRRQPPDPPRPKSASWKDAGSMLGSSAPAGARSSISTATGRWRTRLISSAPPARRPLVLEDHPNSPAVSQVAALQMVPALFTHLKNAVNLASTEQPVIKRRKLSPPARRKLEELRRREGS